jgi:xanthine dehydrogenase accessory factor
MSIGRELVLIKGAGDLGSGVALRLHRCGFSVVMTETKQPLAVRRGVAFGQAVYDGHTIVQGVTARLVGDVAQSQEALWSSVIPVLVDPDAACRQVISPDVLLDALMAKANTGTKLEDAPLVLALGPGFEAGVDCHAVIETCRGHDLGRVLWSGGAIADTGIPGVVGGQSGRRVLRAPAAGYLTPIRQIGDMVKQGEVIGRVGDAEVVAPFDGVVRGLIHESVFLTPGMKIGDVDPRGIRQHCFTVSDKALAIAGGVLEAILIGQSSRSG